MDHSIEPRSRRVYEGRDPYRPSEVVVKDLGVVCWSPLFPTTVTSRNRTRWSGGVLEFFFFYVWFVGKCRCLPIVGPRHGTVHSVSTGTVEENFTVLGSYR